MRHFTKLIWVAISLFAITTSCSKDEIFESSEVIERSNIKFEGDQILFDIQENEENDDTKDLIETELNSNSTKDLTFTINLENGHTLSVRIYNKYASEVWESSTNFPIYTTADSSEHWKYCEATYILNDDAASYATHLGNIAPTELDINPFNILSYDPTKMEVKCEFNDMTLFKNIDISKTITVNGTFISAISFK